MPEILSLHPQTLTVRSSTRQMLNIAAILGRLATYSGAMGGCASSRVCFGERKGLAYGGVGRSVYSGVHASQVPDSSVCALLCGSRVGARGSLGVYDKRSREANVCRRREEANVGLCGRGYGRAGGEQAVKEVIAAGVWTYVSRSLLSRSIHLQCPLSRYAFAWLHSSYEASLVGRRWARCGRAPTASRPADVAAWPLVLGEIATF